MESMSHRFAAVLAADVVNYSRLMERDSEKTVRALKDCRSIFRRCVSSHHGREFGSVGDSLMAEFPSPVEALRAAREIHVALGSLEPVGKDTALKIRIGLDAGDVISDGDNLFGDVVNTAARLQAMAQPGGTLLSGLVHAQVKKEAGFQFRSLGLRSLKNIAEPVQVYEVERQHRRFTWRRLRLLFLPYRVALAAALGVLVTAMLFAMYLESQSPGIGSVIDVPALERSVAVLPFRSSNSTAENAFVVDGMHADILTQLAKLESFERVISRASVERYRGAQKSVGEIAAELGVANIVAGIVQLQGNRVRVNIELINAASDTYVWAESYDRELTAEDLFAMQSDIAMDVALALQAAVEGEDGSAAESPHTTNLEAYGEFVAGQEAMWKLTPEALDRAERHFENAISRDSGYASAHVALADTLGLQTQFLPDVSFNDTFERRQESIMKALTIDPQSGAAYSALAFLRATQNRWQEAEEQVVRAIELSPNYAVAHHVYALLLMVQGRDDEAMVSFRKAFALDPVNPLLVQNFSGHLSSLGYVEEAEARLLDGIRQNPEFTGLYESLYMHWIIAGRTVDALRALDAWLAVTPNDQRVRKWRCFALIHLGDNALAEDCVTKLEAEIEGELTVHRIMLDTVQGRPVKALERLEKFAARQDLGWQARHFVGQQYVLHQLPAKALPFANDIAPEMMGERDVTVTFRNSRQAILAATVLYQQGRVDRASYLFDQLLEMMRMLPRNRGESVQFRDILIHVVRDETELAIAALRDAVHHRWRSGAWFLRAPIFAELDDDPRWRELVEQLESEMEEEIRRYQERKDDPLF